MKTLTITLHDTDNCGSSLQAFALQYFLKENNIENQIINYVPSYVKNNGHPIKTFIRKIIFFKESRAREEKNQQFINQYLTLTPDKYSSYKELEKNPPKGDIYITGSDQLWNSSYACGRDKAFYLKFADNGKKISYAMSLGKSEVPQEEVNWILSNIQDFNWISVRENSSKVLLESKGISNIAYVCDPVLLLNQDIYKKMQKPVIRDKKYIFIYLVEKSEVLENVIRYLKKLYNYEIVFFGSYRSKCTCDVHMRDISPGEFLDLIANAQIVLSGSFHATVFSHIYHKRFVTILPANNQARIKQFLQVTGLERCIINQSSDIENAFADINYDNVGATLNKFIESSKDQLLNSLYEISR